MAAVTMLRAGAVRIAAHRLRTGAADEPAYVAVHGFLDHAGAFAPLAGALARGTFWALDLPGHGLSSDLGGRPYLFVDFVADTVRALEALGEGPFVLVGHSLGAGIAAFAAVLAADRVARLVLLDGLGPLVDDEDALPERMARALREEARLRRVPRKVYPTVEAARATFAAVRGELSAAAVDALVPGSLERVDGGLAWAADPLVRAPSRLRLTEGHVAAFLRRLRCPVLVVAPDAGFLARHRDVAEARRARIADVRTVGVPGGHHAHVEDPGPVARAVEAFAFGRPQP